MGAKSSGSKPVFFDGQLELAAEIFGSQGPFRALLEGGPDAGFEAGAQRSRQALGFNLSEQGLAGQPLGAKAQVDLERGIATDRESNRLQTLLGAIQPAGTKSSSSGAGVFTK